MNNFGFVETAGFLFTFVMVLLMGCNPIMAALCLGMTAMVVYS
jgi:hypothetical protein